MGVHLVNTLKRSKYEVVVTSRKERKSEENITYVTGNAKDKDFLKKILSSRYKAIFNFMTYTTEEFRDVVNLLLSSTDHYFFLSSSRVYAECDNLIDEESPRLLDVCQDSDYLSTDNYALSKAREEDILRTSEFNNWTIIRPYLTYSEERLQLGFLEAPFWLGRAAHGKSILFSSDLSSKYTTLTYGKDVANVMSLLIDNEASLGEVIQITCGKHLLWSEVLDIYVKEIERVLKKPVKIFFTKDALLDCFPSERWTYKYDRIFNRCFNSDKLNKILGFRYEFTPPEEGLKLCVSEYIKNHRNDKSFILGLVNLDRLTNESYSLKEIGSFKAYFHYNFLRYTNKNIINMLKTFRNRLGGGRISKIIKKVLTKVLNIENEIIPIITPTACDDLIKDKVVMITGGTGGIGFAIAKACVNAGAKVILCGTNTSKLQKYQDILGENSRSIELHLNKIETLETTIKEALKCYPEKKIDVLVNSAGVHGDWSVKDLSEDEYDKVMDVNVKGTFFLTNLIGQYMITNKIKGHILNISSSSALRPAFTPYQISKWAINGMTKGFADILLPHGIVVNGLAPGPTATEMVKDTSTDNIYYEHQPSHRYATPEEIANLALFMISPMGNMIVGDTFYMTGGSGTISYHR